MITVEIVNEQSALDVDFNRLRCAVQNVLEQQQVQEADVNVALVDDATIHRINRQFLNHDCPTDVISFRLDEEGDDGLEGELVISSETAISQAAQFGLSPEDELLLYAIHGTLHLVGFDDIQDSDRQIMREQESLHLSRLGISIPRHSSTETERHIAASPADSPSTNSIRAKQRTSR